MEQQQQLLEEKEKVIQEQKEQIRELETRNKMMQQNFNINIIESDKNTTFNNINSLISNKSTMSFNSSKSLANSMLLLNHNEVDGQNQNYKQLVSKMINNFNINMEIASQNNESNYQYLSNQIYLFSKEMKHFRQFYSNMLGIIRDCYQKEYEPQNTKQGLKYIWKWIKTILDSFIKVKLQKSYSAP